MGRQEQADMGWVTNYVAYRIGRRVSQPRPQPQQCIPQFLHNDEPECIHFASFCRSYGSCDGQVCEYE